MPPDQTRRTFLATVPIAVGSASLLDAQRSRNSDDDPEGLVLWYRKPASTWTEALPVGNGRLGAMIFGDAQNERLQLNEDTLWSGAPQNWNNPQAYDHLAAVRELVLKQQKYVEADAVCRQMQGPFTESYQPLGNLHLKFEDFGKITSYRRQLDLSQAVARVSFQASGTAFTREIFASAPDQVIVVRLTADRANALTFTATFDNPLPSNCTAEENQRLRLTGKAPARVDPNYVESDKAVSFDDAEGRGMRFECAAHFVLEGGAAVANGHEITVSNATAVTIVVAGATGYRGYNRVPDLAAATLAGRCRATLNTAAKKSYGTLRSAHTREYKSFFDRVSLDLGPNRSAHLATDERLREFQKQASDQHLIALYFHYGRYLLISSSRPGTQPANLQGIWNDLVRPPWSSNWTSNINLQMNYWPAETCNLSDCHLPLFDLIDGLVETGTKTAAENYHARGWVTHHNVDIWRHSAPVGAGSGDPVWANWPMCAPWLCAHLWEHYRFTGDLQFLRSRAYPVMKRAALFCLDWLIPGPDGKLTTCPSISPENHFLAPSGKPAAVSAGCTMDLALLGELFEHCIQALHLLGVDADFGSELQEKRQLLPEYRIGSHGQLQEWSIDFAEPEPGQRHMSHLYPLYPGSEFTPRRKTEFWKAARISLERRLAAGGGYTGWSRAWVICFWARLLEGDRAHESVCALLNHSTAANLFDTHPADEGAIFQIDGNFGAIAGVAEMLLQSHEEEISLLPALPAAWPSGSVGGLRARGGALIDIVWSGGRLTKATCRPSFTAELRFRVPAGQKVVRIIESPGHKSIQARLDSDLLRVHVAAGKVYELIGS